MEKTLIRELISKVDDMVESGILKEKILILGPVNVYVRMLIYVLEKRNCQISGVIDNNVGLQKYNLSGKPIIAVEKIKQYPLGKVKVLLISRYFSEIRDQLYYMGMDTDDIIEVIEILKEKKRVDFSILLKEAGYAWEKAQRGKKLYCKIKAENPDGKKIALFPYNSLGDVFILGLYKSALYDIYGKDIRLILVGDGCVQIARWFGYQTYKINEDEKKVLMRYAQLVPGSDIVILHFMYWHTSILSGISYLQKLDFIHLYSQVVFDGASLRLEHGRTAMENAIQEIKEIGWKPCKIVILSPYAKSLPELSPVFWERLAERLQELECCVYTNCTGDCEIEIYGTERLEMRLCDLIYLINQSEKSYFIGLRSGLCDVLGLTKGKKLIIYPDNTSKILYSLKYLDNPNIEEFVFVNDNMFLKDIVEKVEDVLK